MVAYVSKGDEEKGQRAFDHTKDMIALFEDRTGQPYPYVKYSQIVVEDFIFGGMENTSRDHPHGQRAPRRTRRRGKLL